MRSLLLVFLASCASDGSSSGMGGNDDPEGPIDPGPRNNLVSVEVTVHADLPNAPLSAGTPVSFNDPSGWGFIVMTDANGVARGEVVDGGSVTALVDDGENPPQLSTILGVREGDQLHLGRTRPPWGGSPSTGTPACSNVDFTATFTNVTMHEIAQLGVQREVSPFGNDNSSETTIEPTVLRTISGPGGVTAGLHVWMTGPAGESQRLFEVIDGCQTSYEQDLSAMLPWLGVPVVSQYRRIDVPYTGGTLEGDVSTMMMGFSTDDVPFVHWFVLGPPVDTFVMPKLSGVLAPMNPVLSRANIKVQLTDYEAVDGYDDARAILGTPTGIGGFAPIDPGRVRWSSRL